MMKIQMLKRRVRLLNLAIIGLALLLPATVFATSLTWEPKVPLPAPMSRIDATVLNDQVYVVGEWDVLRYDPSIDTWNYAMPAGEQVFYPSVLTLDNAIYLVGGDARGTGISDTRGIWSYDPNTGGNRVASTLEPRFFADATALNGKIYIAGGSEADALTLSLSIEEFDPATGISQVVGQLPAGRFLPAVETDGEWIYILGGQDETGIPTNTCWAFKPTTGEFRENAPLLTPVWTRSAFAALGKIYLVGGVTGPGGPFAGPPSTWTLDIQEYNPRTNSWQLVGQLPTSRFTPAVALAGDTLYVMGGDLGPNAPIMSVETDIVEAAVLSPGQNMPPVCSGAPADSAMAGQFYSFTPDCVDPEGDSLSFSIVNQPPWASFDPDTGTLSGTPTQSDIGLYEEITISVTDRNLNSTALKFGDFALTTGTYLCESDWESAVGTELASAYRVADWSDLAAYYATGGDLLDLMDGLGFGWNDVHAFVTVNGSKQWAQDPSRYYFISRHDHMSPSTYLVHDSLDNNFIVLGSWYVPRLILAIKNPPVSLQPFSITVNEPMVVNAYDKTYYQDQSSMKSSFYVTGGVAPYTVSLDSGSFPPGIDFLATTQTQSLGKYGGTATEQGTWSFVISATDAEGHTALSAEVSIRVVEGVVITTTSLPDAVAGQPYTATIAAAGGVNNGNFAWWMWTSGYQLPAGLSFPEGLSFTPNDGVGRADMATISGVPTTVGTYVFVVDAMEVMWGGYDRVSFTLNVIEPCTDADGDGYAVEGGTCGQVDCNDADPMSYPGAPEIIGDGIDQDCSGLDLTIVITRAVYTVADENLIVDASSAYGETAALELEEYGPMEWNSSKEHWQLKVKSLAPADVPTNVSVFGPEGTVYLPVNWD